MHASTPCLFTLPTHHLIQSHEHMHTRMHMHSLTFSISSCSQMCQLASPGDEVEEEYDGDLRHAALQLLIGWHYTHARQHYGDVIASWFAQRALSDRSMCMLSVALEAVDHPSMAVRKAAAHLFSEAAEYARSSSSGGNGGSGHEASCSQQSGAGGNSNSSSSSLAGLVPEAVALLTRLSGEVDQLLGSCARQADPDAAAPQVHSLLHQGPMTASLLLGQQLATQKKKHKVGGEAERGEEGNEGEGCVEGRRGRE
jgi:hypothetical protein